MGTAEPHQLTVTVLTNRDDDFYPVMGPFLAQRHIVAEVGGPIWDDEGKRWWVVRDADRVVGFAAAVADGDVVTLRSAWVDPDYRRRGIHTDLVRQRVEAYPGCRFRSVVTAASLPQLLAAGFAVVRHKGAFTEVRRG